jgi:hypothetical protein
VLAVAVADAGVSGRDWFGCVSALRSETAPTPGPATAPVSAPPAEAGAPPPV